MTVSVTVSVTKCSHAPRRHFEVVWEVSVMSVRSPVKMWRALCSVLFPFFLISVTSAKPNIIVFLVDDLGIADLGCFGNDTIKTPNIDQLAEEGARLRHDVMPDSVCTPNRAALLTGRYPIRSGLASDEGQLRMFLSASASGGLPQNETTFAEIASAAGYRTGWSDILVKF